MIRPATFARRLSRAAAAVLPLFLLACAPPPKQVWFSPNLASEDMLDLFTRPEQWEKARSQVTVFKFYSREILADETGCPDCGANRLPNLARVEAFSRLRGWGKEIALDVDTLKSWGCRAEVTLPFAREAIRRVLANGGSVRYLSMDEPLLGGELCGYTLEQSAEETAAFVRVLYREYPEVAVGDIEPYPYFRAERLATWMQALRHKRVPLSFFHLDVDRVRADRLAIEVAGDLRSMQGACRVLGLSFGVILWGGDGTTDETYSEDVLRWTHRVADATGQPEHTVFQSWALSADGRRRVPVNLPEDDSAVFSHTRLINEGLAILRDGSH